jgi:hypothetical protein
MSGGIRTLVAWPGCNATVPRRQNAWHSLLILSFSNIALQTIETNNRLLLLRDWVPNV